MEEDSNKNENVEQKKPTYAAIRIRREIKRKIQNDLEKINSESLGPPIGLEDYLTFAVSLLAPQHLEQLRCMIFDKRDAGPAEAFERVKWLTTSEAARYLRVSISSIKTMIYRGQVRVHKLGRRNRFLRDDLDRLITSPFRK